MKLTKVLKQVLQSTLKI